MKLFPKKKFQKEKPKVFSPRFLYTKRSGEPPFNSKHHYWEGTRFSEQTPCALAKAVIALASPFQPQIELGNEQ